MSSRHTLKFNDWEATDSTGRINSDYALTEGRVVDSRDPADYGEDSDIRHRARRRPDWYYGATEPLKRGHAEDVPRLERDRWHVGHVREGRDWTCGETPLTPVNRRLQREATRITGIPAAVPETEWSMSPWRCAVCWDQLDKPPLPEKAKYCSPACKRAADAARKARKRRLADGVRKYPRDDQSRTVIHEPRPVLIPSGPDGLGSFNITETTMVAREVESTRYGNQFTPWPRSGLSVIRPSDPREDLEVRHGIMTGIRRRPTTPPSWWVDTVSAILTADQGRSAA